ncbi:MAG: YndJ family protein, partial [Candidatus Zixiibacteriota bacterium]
YSQPVCALAVCISYLYPTGVTAGALALAWFFYTALLAALGLVRVAVERMFASDQLALNAGLLYSIIGGGWLVLSRLGATPMDFGHLITLLTSVHFHYAGFAALVFVGLTGRRLTRAVPSLRPIYDLLVYGTILSISLLAVGITLSPLIEVISAFILAACLTVLALMTFIIVVRRVRKKSARTLLAIASVSLVVGMVFALLYAVSQYSESYVISILRMAHYHGWANSLLFSVCGLWAWNLAESVE